MLRYRTVQDFWFFSRRYMQFERVSNLAHGLLKKESEVSEEARKTLRQLHMAKVACKEKIARLDLPSVADCSRCSTGCCFNPSEYYFTPIDFWLNKYSSHKTFGYADHSVKPYHYYVTLRIRSLVMRLAGSQHDFPPPSPSRDGVCAYLGKNGCKLPHHERPIKCLLYVCPRLRNAMDDATREAYIDAIEQLYDISVRAFDVVKVEAGFPPRYGKLSLMLTL